VAVSPRIDDLRRQAAEKLDPVRRAAMGQFMTPSPIAKFMASLFRKWSPEAKLLDAGAGVGSLTEAFIERFKIETPQGTCLSVRAFEVEPILVRYLSEHLNGLTATPSHTIRTEVVERDFLREGAFALCFGGAQYTHAILNPPYKKIGATSEHRLLLRRVGIDTVNLYTAFLGLAVALTKPGGEIVAIIPRSFCNGMYFRPFRRWLLNEASLTHIHVFESRDKAFHEDDVLQENVIIRLERNCVQGPVTISSSHDPSFVDYSERFVPFSNIVKPTDQEQYIHIPVSEFESASELFTHRLQDLGLGVSTGPVVDFRVRSHWLDHPTENSAPLLYTRHFRGGKIRWPQDHKKPNALTVNDDTKKWLMPGGWYTITKRFSAKEERRRLVAYVVDPATLPYELVGFENHLNVIHSEKRGLDPDIARGMALFLNATITDQHFRNFSGHTQVNATDLRTMLYPRKETLLKLGRWAAKHGKATQEEIDAVVEGTHGAPGRVARNSGRSRPPEKTKKSAIRPLPSCVT
jgi:adenine-specific DNA-methyltransferase